MEDQNDQKIPDGISTFIWWVKYEQGPVKVLNKGELGHYESNYVRCWNYVRDRGWDKIDGKWVSPDRSKKYSTVYEAYNAQKYYEMVESQPTLKYIKEVLK